ncbi:hypothetical protein ABZ746_34330 [Streptomyces sp. NPDC020096]
MPRDKSWLTRPDVTVALAYLDAHYAVLGCDVGGDRLDEFLERISRFQTKDAFETLRPAFDALASEGPTARAVRDLALGTWLTFLEPAQGLATVIDSYGVADDRVGRPGAFGRQWARHACDAAWTIWIASGGYAGARGAGIAR